MVYSRSNTEFASRLTLNGNTLDRIEEVKLLGVWVTTFMDWEKNTRELCKNAFARMTMITKLKYVGTSREDLLDVCVLYIRSILEYCSVVWHSTLTVEQIQDLESIQKLCLKVILGQKYTGYENALEYFCLDKLSDRREKKCLEFGLKCLLHPVHSKMFPVNPNTLQNPHGTRNSEHFTVNWAKSESYRQSSIPYIQRLLNVYVSNQKKSRP